MAYSVNNTAAVAGVQPLSKRILASISAALLGLIILYGAGFAPQDVVHNAAHDSRHSFAFPCH